jgi:hypothetical protein
MLAAGFYKVPVAGSLAVIILVLALSVAASWVIAPRAEPDESERREKAS